MGITIFGRGIPLSAVDDGSTLSIAYNGTAIADISTTGLSATLSGGTYAGNLSGTVVGSAGSTKLTMSAAAAGNHLICAAPLVGTGAASGVSGNAVLVVAYNGRNYYIPAFSAVQYA